MNKHEKEVNLNDLQGPSGNLCVNFDFKFIPKEFESPT
jgi:hypothetical protein